MINNLYYLLLIVLLVFSCVPARTGGHEHQYEERINDSKDSLYPEEMELYPSLKIQLENYDSGYFQYMDTKKMKLYSLGDYYIMRSNLTGPTGRGSNYFYYLLVDKRFSKDIFSISLSRETKNIWLSKGLLFINILDFDDEAYCNGEYYICDSCDFSLIHTRQSSHSFSLDTIGYEKRTIMWKDIETYTAM